MYQNNQNEQNGFSFFNAPRPTNTSSLFREDPAIIAARIHRPSRPVGTNVERLNAQRAQNQAVQQTNSNSR